MVFCGRRERIGRGYPGLFATTRAERGSRHNSERRSDGEYEAVTMKGVPYGVSITGGNPDSADGARRQVAKSALYERNRYTQTFLYGVIAQVRPATIVPPSRCPRFLRALWVRYIGSIVMTNAVGEWARALCRLLLYPAFRFAGVLLRPS